MYLYYLFDIVCVVLLFYQHCLDNIDCVVLLFYQHCLDNIVLFCADKYEHVKIWKAFFSFTGGVFFYAMRQKNQPNRRFKGYTPPCAFKYFPQNEYYFFR